ncbi:MAG: hypothetical protein HYT68_00015 [Candidatus Zambryskibacteria bacterium]|nr:hypothetical protein [Candidatus Zambryskibacteria bacterium]
MSNATFSQAAHILRIVEEKATPKSQLQDIIGAGLLADLLDANVGEVNREEFRKLLGLHPLGQESLRDPNTFFRTRKGLWVSNDYRDLVVAKAEPTVTIPAFKHVLLQQDMNDTEIEEMLGDKHLFTETEASALIADLISKQEGGKEGELLNNGYANLLYLGSCVVLVHWYAGSRKWFVNTWKRDDDRWNTGLQLFSPAN